MLLRGEWGNVESGPSNWWLNSAGSVLAIASNSSNIFDQIYFKISLNSWLETQDAFQTSTINLN